MFRGGFTVVTGTPDLEPGSVACVHGRRALGVCADGCGSVSADECAAGSVVRGRFSIGV